ncbi:MAG: hypothetical protein JWR16_2827 [Nevskia sp.]|nr:hypothetical protein [Nevskia sp.]
MKGNRFHGHIRAVHSLRFKQPEKCPNLMDLKTGELTDKLLSAGLLEIKDGENYLTAKGKELGGEFRMSSKFGAYFLWPETISI